MTVRTRYLDMKCRLFMWLLFQHDKLYWINSRLWSSRINSWLLRNL